MNKRISARQLVRMMILFQLGSAIAIPLATGAKQDSWIVILLGMCLGTLLTFIYLKIYSSTNGNNFEEILEEILGHKLGKMIALIYLVYFLYIANRVINDFRIIIKSTALPETPNIAIICIMSVPVIYCCYLDIETMGRGAVILHFIVMFTLLVLFIFTFINKLPKLERLEPVLEYGVGPVIKFLFPLAITVPYGESMTFLNIFAKINEREAAKINKIAILSNIISGIILAITSALNVMILSADIVERSIFPVLKVVGNIQIGTFLQRLDVFAILLLMLGGFYKILIFFYCSVEITMSIFNFNLKHRNLVLGVLGLIMIIMAYYFKANPIEHFHIGLDIVPLYMHIPLQLIIPCILLIIIFVKNKLKKDSD